MIGRRLGHYEVAARLGEGGMGEVYRATDTKLGREIALKVLPAGMASNPERLERFRREARALAALDHPNIVTVHSVEESDGVSFLTMQLVEGQPLDRLIPRGGLPLDRLVEIATALAEALAAAHERGIIHRDLKPANVVIAESGLVKVLDFGLAKMNAVGESSGSEPTEAHTWDGVVMGTAPYMSPEQISGRPVDHRSDVFSLGVVLYEIASGRRPFEGHSTAELASAILRDRPPPVRDLRQDVPPELDRLIRRCLEKDPRQRLQTARDAANELREMARPARSRFADVGTDGVARPTGTPSRSRSMTYALAALSGIAIGVLALLAYRPDVANSTSEGGNTGLPPPAPAAFLRAAGDNSQPKVAVLPCENLSPNQDDAWFASGIHEEILNQLSKLSGVRVIARTSVLQYAESRRSISQIARELDAAAVMECTVRFAGTDIRVTAQLVDPATNAHIWSHAYPGDLSDLDGVFAMQADIATNIARALDAGLQDAEARRLGGTPTDLPEAYVAFLKSTEGSSVERLAHLDRAIELDARFGLAYAARGLIRLERALQADAPGARSLDFDTELALAIADADRALVIDPDLGLAHVVAAARYLAPVMDRARLEAALDRALALSPNNVRVLHLIAGAYLADLRLDESRALLQRIVQLDPHAGLNPTTSEIGEFLFLSGDLDGAVDLQRRYIEREPTAAPHHHVLAFLEALRGRTDEALQALEVAERLLETSGNPDVYRLGYMIAYTYHRLGRPADARRAFDRFVAPASRTELLPMMWVLAYFAIGNVDRAYGWAATLKTRPRVPWPTPELWLVLNPMEDPELDSPRFLQLRRRLGYR